jgi:hypothetical protein
MGRHCAMQRKGTCEVLPQEAPNIVTAVYFDWSDGVIAFKFDISEDSVVYCRFWNTAYPNEILETLVDEVVAGQAYLPGVTLLENHEIYQVGIRAEGYPEVLGEPTEYLSGE